MKEELYTIPVTDAFTKDCECPICTMLNELEQNAIDFTMGPSYMEDDIRAQTDISGFCDKHISKLYNAKNRLGLALILKTHMDKTIMDITNLSAKQDKPSSHTIFKKKSEPSVIKAYTDKLDSSCFVCERIDHMFTRYLVTVFYLYKQDNDFKKSFANSKGFCTKHYGLLYDMAKNYLNGSLLDDFLTTLNTLYLANMNRVKGDLEWFIDKFDYRYTNEPWKNSKDALKRTILKTNSIEEE